MGGSERRSRRRESRSRSPASSCGHCKTDPSSGSTSELLWAAMSATWQARPAAILKSSGGWEVFEKPSARPKTPLFECPEAAGRRDAKDLDTIWTPFLQLHTSRDFKSLGVITACLYFDLEPQAFPVDIASKVLGSVSVLEARHVGCSCWHYDHECSR